MNMSFSTIYLYCTSFPKSIEKSHKVHFMPQMKIKKLSSFFWGYEKNVCNNNNNNNTLKSLIISFDQIMIFLDSGVDNPLLLHLLFRTNFHKKLFILEDYEFLSGKKAFDLEVPRRSNENNHHFIANYEGYSINFKPFYWKLYR